MRINSYTKKDDETVSKRKSYSNIHTELAKKNAGGERKKDRKASQKKKKKILRLSGSYT